MTFEPLEVFYSYADPDEPLQKELDKHLRLLQRNGLITTWHKRRILAGTDWVQNLDERLRTASVILLLISVDFVASNYCDGPEITLAMQRHRAGQARVIPILLRPVDNWQGMSFGKLAALPSNDQPVSQWSDRDAAFVDVARGIRDALEEVQRLRPISPSVFPDILLRGGSHMNIYGSSTPPGNTKWVQYNDEGIYVDIDTSVANFKATPLYFTSLEGKTRHWKARGNNSIYQATRSGFRIYLYYSG